MWIVGTYTTCLRLKVGALAFKLGAFVCKWNMAVILFTS